MTTADSLSITRLGDTIKIDDFWATLSVILPKGINLELSINEIRGIKNLIHYAEKNRFGSFQDGTLPNDPKFSLYDSQHNHHHVLFQAGLTGTINGINLADVSSGSDPHFIEGQGGWKYETGSPSIKIGVVDTGVRWQHEDLGDGTWSGSRVKGGWDYGKGVHPSAQLNSDPINNSGSNGHGTAVAGIIGAIRNNNLGVAGIAGGDFGEDKDGVSLYTLRTSSGKPEDEDTLFTITTASEAIVEGAVYNPITGYGFGLDVQNYSWRMINDHPEIDTILYTLRNAVHCAYKNGTVQVASSGNLYFPFESRADTNFYPASFKNEWMLKIGAFEVVWEGQSSHRERTNFSVFGTNIDVLAPGTLPTVHTLSNNGLSTYKSFSGTSASAPHVSGVVALLLSMHNPTYEPMYPNKLAVEDVEYLIKLGASPIIKDNFEPNTTLSTQNKYSGHGALNANKTLERSSLPYKVYHFNHKIDMSNGVLVSSGQSIEFIEGINNLPEDAVIGNTSVYEISENTQHLLPSGCIHLDGWIRNSSSDLYALVDTIHNKQWSGTKLLSSSLNNAEIIGYYYETEILTPDSTYTIVSPHPDGNGAYNIAYSIYVKDTSITLEIEDYNFTENNIIIYPNPSKQHVNIESKHIPINSVFIYDISGKLIQSLSVDGKNIKVDVSSYSEGIYLFSLISNDKIITKKFIKY